MKVLNGSQQQSSKLKVARRTTRRLNGQMSRMWGTVYFICLARGREGQRDAANKIRHILLTSRHVRLLTAARNKNHPHTPHPNPHQNNFGERTREGLLSLNRASERLTTALCWQSTHLSAALETRVHRDCMFIDS